MQKFRQSLFALAGLLLVLGAIAALNPSASRGQPGQPGNRPPSDVNVVNTPTVNVAGTPSVNVANTPTVNVAGTPSVNVSNAVLPVAGTVTVGNAASSPVPVRDADAPSAQPFQRELFNPSGPNTPDHFIVPAGKRLVIEHVSGYVRINGPSTCNLEYVAVDTRVGGESAIHFFVPTQTATDQIGPHYIYSEEARLYADPGTQVRLSHEHTIDAGCTSHVVAAISGHLVDVP